MATSIVQRLGPGRGFKQVGESLGTWPVAFGYTPCPMAERLPIVHLHPGREKKIRGGYPWVQREEVAGSEPCEPGALARLYSADREFLAVGTFLPGGRFPFRVFSLRDEPIDEAWFHRRFQATLARREALPPGGGRRIAFSEADGLPGLIADQFGPHVVAQVRSRGMAELQSAWLPALAAIPGVESIYEKSDMEGRTEEGLEPSVGPLVGNPPEGAAIEEAGIRFRVPIREGLKTGFYLDQRESRRRLRERVRPGERVLDAFCYVGGFALSAAAAGAEAEGVDLSSLAIAEARLNAEANGLASRCRWHEANAFDWLEREPDRSFDWIVLDPPAIAKRDDRKDSLKWAIWKLVYHGLPWLRPGGRMVVCSCSYQLGLEPLLETIRLAANDRGLSAFLEETTWQAPDHPHLLQFPESLYLKCAWVRFEDR